MSKNYKALHDLLTSMKSRMPWNVARMMLIRQRIPVGMGWQQTLEKIKEFSFDDDQLETLTETFKDHLICGEKAVRYYDLTKSQIQHIRKYYSDVKIKKSEFSEIYPLSVDQKQIGQLPFGKPVLVAVEKRDDGIAAIYSSIRISEIRDTLTSADIPVAARSFFSQYSELIAVKTEKAQVFDIVWIPNSGNIIDIRVDAPQSMSFDIARAAQGALAGIVENETGFSMKTPINLFPLIDKIYSAQKEGTVVELAFMTTTGSSKHEKMRKKKACLRKEIYHKGGKAALKGKISPYKLGVQWPVIKNKKTISSPELNLYSNTRMVFDSAPILHDATVRKCAGIEDFNLVQSKIRKFLAA